MDRASLPACTALDLAEELASMLEPLLPAPVRFIDLHHASSLEACGLGHEGLDRLGLALEHRFLLPLRPLNPALCMGDLIESLLQGLRERPPLLPYHY